MVGAMIEIIRSTAEYPEEMVIATLERTEIRQEAEMPFTDKRCAVAGAPKERRQRRMAWRQPDVLGRVCVDRLLQSDREAILIASSDQGRTRGRTHGRIGIGLGKFHPFERKPVHVRRRVVGLAIATHIGKAEIVGENED